MDRQRRHLLVAVIVVFSLDGVGVGLPLCVAQRLFQSALSVAGTRGAPGRPWNVSVSNAQLVAVTVVVPIHGAAAVVVVVAAAVARLRR
jgi:hypothetical protein